MLQDRLGQTPKIHVSGSCSRSYPYEWTSKVHAKLSAKLPYYTVGTYPLAGLFAGGRIMAPRPPVSIPRPRARNMQVCRISLPTKSDNHFGLLILARFMQIFSAPSRATEMAEKASSPGRSCSTLTRQCASRMSAVRQHVPTREYKQTHRRCAPRRPDTDRYTTSQERGAQLHHPTTPPTLASPS